MRTFLSFLHHALPLICGALLMIIGGVIGVLDAGSAGLGVGAIIGLLAGTGVGFIASNAISLLCGRHVPGKRSDESQATAQAPVRRWSVCGCVFRILSILILLVVLHDCYWFANMWMSTVNYNSGAYMTRAIVQDYSSQQLKNELKAHRWRHDILAARPLRWLCGESAATVNQANRELIEVLTRERIETPAMRLDDVPTTRTLAELWDCDYWFFPDITNKGLHVYGTAVCIFTAGQLHEHKSRGLLLRYMPIAWFQ